MTFIGTVNDSTLPKHVNRTVFAPSQAEFAAVCISKPRLTEKYSRYGIIALDTMYPLGAWYEVTRLVSKDKAGAAICVSGVASRDTPCQEWRNVALAG